MIYRLCEVGYVFCHLCYAPVAHDCWRGKGSSTAVLSQLISQMGGFGGNFIGRNALCRLFCGHSKVILVPFGGDAQSLGQSGTGKPRMGKERVWCWLVRVFLPPCLVQQWRVLAEAGGGLGVQATWVPCEHACLARRWVAMPFQLVEVWHAVYPVC